MISFPNFDSLSFSSSCILCNGSSRVMNFVLKQFSLIFCLCHIANVFPATGIMYLILYTKEIFTIRFLFSLIYRLYIKILWVFQDFLTTSRKLYNSFKNYFIMNALYRIMISQNIFEIFLLTLHFLQYYTLLKNISYFFFAIPFNSTMIITFFVTRI